MPRILVDNSIIGASKTSDQKRKKIINKVEKIAHKVFGPKGPLLLKPGAVEIIPAFGAFGGKNQLHIFLHKKPERTDEILADIAEGFEEPLKGYIVFFNDQPEEFWRRF